MIQPKRMNELANEAFQDAIESGRLSAMPADSNYAGKYMYMGQSRAEQSGKTLQTVTLFKNINTREYLK